MADLKMCWLPASRAAGAFEEGLSGGRALMGGWFEVSCEPKGAPGAAQRGGNSPGAPAWINHRGLGKGMSEEKSKKERRSPSDLTNAAKALKNTNPLLKNPSAT